LDEFEQNIVICQWRADQLFTEAEGWGRRKIKIIIENSKNPHFYPVRCVQNSMATGEFSLQHRPYIAFVFFSTLNV